MVRPTCAECSFLDDHTADSGTRTPPRCVSRALAWCLTAAISVWRDRHEVSRKVQGGRRVSFLQANSPRYRLHANAARRYRCAHTPFQQEDIYKHQLCWSHDLDGVAMRPTYFAQANPDGPAPTIQTFLTENFPAIAPDILCRNMHSTDIWYLPLATSLSSSRHGQWRQHATD